MKTGRPAAVDKKLKFIEWWDNPDRGKCSRDELCKQLGVHRNTLVNWSKELRIARSMQTDDEEGRTKKVLDELYKEATNPQSSAAKVKAIELYAKMKGILVEKTENKNLNLNREANIDFDTIARGVEAKLSDFRSRLLAGTPSV